MNETSGASIDERVLYAELAPQEFRARLAAAPIAYLPLGTLEWHGEHLPLGSDGLQSQGFFVHLARRAGGIVLPMLFVGPDIRQTIDGHEYYGMDIVGFAKGAPQQLDGSAYWIAEEQFKALIEAILGQLQRAGFKIVVAHGHGPSTHLFNKHRQDWSARFDMQLLSCWNPADPDRATGVQTDHAAANETSLMQALHPDLVFMDRLPPDPAVWPTALSGEDPRTHASPARGQEIIRKNLEWMAQVLHEALQNQT